MNDNIKSCLAHMSNKKKLRNRKKDQQPMNLSIVNIVKNIFIKSNKEISFDKYVYKI